MSHYDEQREQLFAAWEGYEKINKEHTIETRKSHPSKIECIEVVEHLTYCKGNAIKYIWRSENKGKEIEDLQKAIWYLNREIQRLEKRNVINTDIIAQ